MGTRQEGRWKAILRESCRHQECLHCATVGGTITKINHFTLKTKDNVSITLEDCCVITMELTYVAMGNDDISKMHHDFIMRYNDATVI